MVKGNSHKIVFERYFWMWLHWCLMRSSAKPIMSRKAVAQHSMAWAAYKAKSKEMLTRGHVCQPHFILALILRSFENLGSWISCVSSFHLIEATAGLRPHWFFDYHLLAIDHGRRAAPASQPRWVRRPTISPSPNIIDMESDGGGVRSLSSLIILQELMTRINPGNPPKPCEVFDLIGGSSTGG